MKAWKDAEYRAAKILGGKRIVLSGSLGVGPKGDIELPGWHVEVKYRQHFSVYTTFRKVEEIARIEDKNALLILTEKGRHGQLAVMRIENFGRIKNDRH